MNYGQVKEIQSNINMNLTDVSNKAIDNATNIETNTKDIVRNTTAITRNTADISANAKNIEINTADITRNTNDISLNTKNIETNTKDIVRNTTDITRNTADISVNAKNIQTNATDIARNTKDISLNAQNIERNTKDIVRNTTDITRNTADISVNTKNIQTNATDIARNTKDISLNAQNIERNTKDIVRNTTDITRNTADISANAQNIQTNTNDIVRNTQNIEINAQNITVNKETIAKNKTDIGTNKTNISALETWTGKGIKLSNGAANLVEGINQNYTLINEVKTEAGKHSSVSAGNNVEITKVDTDGQADYKVSLKNDITVTSVTATSGTIGGVFFTGNGTLTAGKTIINDTGISFDGKSYITASGLNANSQSITNVGTAVEGTDAVNKTQMETTISTNVSTAIQKSYDQLKKDLSNISSGTIDLAQLTSAGVVGGTRTDSTDGIAVGSGTSVNGNATVAVGRNATAKEWGASAIGGESVANAMHATALGVQSKAQANQSTALGFNTSVTANGAVAIGGNSTADEEYTVSFGKAGSERRLVNVKAGTAGTDAVNKNQMEEADASVQSYFTNAGIVAGTAAKSGANATAIAIGSDSIAKISGAVAVGIKSNAAANNSTAIGQEATASVWAATAIGNKSTASGNGSVAFGLESAATGGYSVAVGSRTQATALNTVAIGNASKVSGERSVGLGSDTYVIGNQSVALGNHSVATEDGVISVGHKATDQKPNGASGDPWDKDLFRRITNVADGLTVNDAATVGQLTGKTFEMNGTTYGGAYISTVDSSVFLRGFGGSSSNNYSGINIDLKKATNVLSQFSEDGKKYAGSADADIGDNDVDFGELVGDTPAKASTVALNRMAVRVAPVSFVDETADTTGGSRGPEDAGYGKSDGTVVENGQKKINENIIVNGTAIFNKGADMANNKVTNVTNGSITENSKDAVNGGQLWQERQDWQDADSVLGSRIDGLGSAVSKLGGEIDSVGAISSALAGLHPLDYDSTDSKYQVSAAIGSYDGSYAFAFGGFYNVNKDVLLSAGVSAILKGERKTAGNVGVTFRVGSGNSGIDLGVPNDMEEARQQVVALKQANNVLAGENRKLAGRIEEQGKKLSAQDEKIAVQDQKLAEMERQLQELLKATTK